MLSKSKPNRLIAAALMAATILGAGSAAATQLFGVGHVKFSVSKSLAASGCITTTSGGSTCALFPAGSSGAHQATVTVLSAGAAGTCCVAFDGTHTAVDSALTINGIPGGCMKIEAAGQTWHQRLNWAAHVSESGTTITGLCSNTVSNAGDTVRAPCDANDDCTAFGGGTCISAANLTAAQKATAGLFMICVPAAGTVVFNAHKDRVDL